MTKSAKEYYRYPAVNPRDRAWGLHVTAAGYQPVGAGGDPIPKRRHPSGHFYTWDAGRVLTEYAVVYVAYGRGEFDSRATGLVPLGPGEALVDAFRSLLDCLRVDAAGYGPVAAAKTLEILARLKAGAAASGAGPAPPSRIEGILAVGPQYPPRSCPMPARGYRRSCLHASAWRSQAVAFAPRSTTWA